MSLSKLTTDKRGLKVDWDFVWGAILFSFLFVVGYALQKAEPMLRSTAPNRPFDRLPGRIWTGARQATFEHGLEMVSAGWKFKTPPSMASAPPSALALSAHILYH
jgi:hypothetical protein